MPQQLKHQLWIVAAAAVVGFVNLGGAALWDEDEPLYASCAREMLQRGDWVVPYYNGRMFPDKPPLMFWTMMLGFKMFGITELGARFWSVVAAVGTGLATYHLGKRLFSPDVGLWSGIVVVSSIIFTISARAATVDSALTLFVTLAVLAFVVGGIEKQRPRLSYAAFWLCLALAVLCKGPAMLLLPAASVGLFLMIANHAERSKSAAEGDTPRRWTARLAGLARLCGPANFLRSLWQMRPLMGVAVVLAVAGPWFVWAGLRDPEMLRLFFTRFNWRPFTEPILGHSGPFWYYVPAIFLGFYPWSVFLGPSLASLVRRLREGHRWAAGYVLVCCWLGVWLVFWTICRTKLPHYVLPAYPALALLTGAFLHAWITEPGHLPAWWVRTAMMSTMMGGLAFAVGAPIFVSIYAPGEELLGLVGLLPIVGGAVCLALIFRRRIRPAVAVYAAMSVALMTVVFGYATLRIDRHQFSRPVTAAIRADSRGEVQVGGFHFLRESLVFYMGRPILPLSHPDEVARFLRQSPNPYVITVDEHVEALQAQFPGELREVVRRPRFLHAGEVVVLTRQTDSPVPRTADRMGGLRK